MSSKTREKLIEVARQLFVRKGIEHTTMNDIATASDKGRRTIYTYFRNKKEIYNAVLEHESDTVVSSLRGIIESDLAPDVKMRRFLLLHLEQSGDASSSYSHIKSLFKFDLRRMERIRRLVYDKETVLLDRILDEGISKGVFRRARCMLLRGFILRCLNGVSFGINQDEENIEMIHADFVNFILSDISVNFETES